MTSPMQADSAALQRLQAHFDGMPPVAAMRVGITGWDGACLRLSAPLAAHVNDKGCAFGGSLVSLATLAAWGLVTLQVEAAGLDVDVFVAATEVRYRAPLFADLHVEARLEEGAGWQDFIDTLRARGRASTWLVASLPLPEGGIATEARLRYAAILRTPVPAPGQAD
ncbi:YiiD C-terminal domain-containing protein [Luteimonas yindakuii]|uniref:YiiD C-terminal domain-containing protein n=1 Tax=Luteimonas yindakuii TaxID=2565782 RepID=UPI001FC924E4|nr:YiiD C-terminal domain-containing protein [Luteimonas yindakuii]